MRYEHVVYSIPLLFKNDGPKCYAKYQRNGRILYRKHKAELKNGKGMTSLDVFIDKAEHIQNIMRSQTGISIYQDSKTIDMIKAARRTI